MDRQYQDLFETAYFHPERRASLLPLLEQGMNRTSSRLEERLEPFLEKDSFFQRLRRRFRNISWKLVLDPGGNYVDVSADGNSYRGDLMPGRPPTFDWGTARVAGENDR